nr:hypothetical protein [uncultured Cohaesibacter sp.]
MTIPSWPSELPKPTRNGYQAQRGDPRLPKNRSTGPKGWRRRWTAVSKPVSLSVQLGRSQKAVFDKFYDEDTKDGTLFFWMPDPVTDGWPLLTSDGSPMLMSDGTPLLMAALWLCKWGEATPVERIVGTEFTISFSVEVMP